MEAEEPKLENELPESQKPESVVRASVELQNQQVEEEVNHTILQTLTEELGEELEEESKEGLKEGSKEGLKEGLETGLEQELEELPNANPYRIFNIVEILIEEYYLDFMKDENMCMCHRCQSDVKAIALTHIPAQYCVFDGEGDPPLVNYFRNKLMTSIIVQTLNACKIVKKSPNHKK